MGYFNIRVQPDPFREPALSCFSLQPFLGCGLLAEFFAWLLVGFHGEPPAVGELPVFMVAHSLPRCKLPFPDFRQKVSFDSVLVCKPEEPLGDLINDPFAVKTSPVLSRECGFATG